MASLHIKYPLLWAAATVFPPVCTVVVLARFATRRAQKLSLGPDDWLVLPAFAIIWGMAVAIMVGAGEKALGYPTPKPPPGATLTSLSEPQKITRKLYFTINLLQLSALTFLKLSCLCFYRRIFRKGSTRSIKLLFNVSCALIAMWGISFFFGFFFACGTHIDYAWGNLADQIACPANIVDLDLSLSITDVIMDVLLLIFPMPLVFRLHLNLSRKLALLGIFLLGALAVAASITRLAIVVEELNVLFAANADQDFVSTDALYFMFLESCFGLCAICLPTLAGAFRLKGVQSFIAGISSSASSLSARRSLRSDNSKSDPQNLHQRAQSPVPSVPSPLHATRYQSPSKGEQQDLELYSLPKETVMVTNADKHDLTP